MNVDASLLDREENPVGLFQTNLKMGLIFAVIDYKIASYPTFNDCRGENKALEIEKIPGFNCWAVNPWTGEINILVWP